jgi:hypothetical protein
VRLYRESDAKPTIRRLTEQLNVHHEALRNWCPGKNTRTAGWGN